VVRWGASLDHSAGLLPQGASRGPQGAGGLCVVTTKVLLPNTPALSSQVSSKNEAASRSNGQLPRGEGLWINYPEADIPLVKSPGGRLRQARSRQSLGDALYNSSYRTVRTTPLLSSVTRFDTSKCGVDNSLVALCHFCDHTSWKRRSIHRRSTSFLQCAHVFLS